MRKKIASIFASSFFKIYLLSDEDTINPKPYRILISSPRTVFPGSDNLRLYLLVNYLNKNTVLKNNIR